MEEELSQRKEESKLDSFKIAKKNANKIAKK